MNTHLFNDLMHVYRKNVSDTWSSEDFLSIGFVYGKLQPTGGTMGTVSGKVNSNVTHIYFCLFDSDIKTGDILYDYYSRKYTVEYTQNNGATGNDDHMEVGVISQ